MVVVMPISALHDFIKTRGLTVEQLQPFCDKINAMTPQEIIDNLDELMEFMSQLALKHSNEGKHVNN